MSKELLQHHRGFSNDQVRDLIAQTIRENGVGFYGQNNEKYEEVLLNQLEKAKKDLANFRKGVAMREIADQFGWSAYDPEEYVEYDHNTYIQFIGTEEEFEQAYPEVLEE